MVLERKICKYFPYRFVAFIKFNDTSIALNSILDWLIPYTTNVVWFTSPDSVRFIPFKLTQIITIHDFFVTESWDHETSLIPQSFHKSWTLNTFIILHSLSFVDFSLSFLFIVVFLYFYFYICIHFSIYCIFISLFI